MCSVVVLGPRQIWKKLQLQVHFTTATLNFVVIIAPIKKA